MPMSKRDHLKLFCDLSVRNLGWALYQMQKIEKLYKERPELEVSALVDVIISDIVDLQTNIERMRGML